MNVAQKTALIARTAVEIRVDTGDKLSVTSGRTLDKILKLAAIGYFDITLKCSAKNAADMKSLGFDVRVVVNGRLYKFSLSL